MRATEQYGAYHSWSRRTILTMFAILVLIGAITAVVTININKDKTVDQQITIYTNVSIWFAILCFSVMVLYFITDYLRRRKLPK